MGLVNVAIVGAGQGASHGKVFAEMIDEVDVAVVCDLDEGRASECAQMLGGSRITTRFEDVLADADVDAVAIAIGCHLHAGAVIAALDAGKHVVVEVPAVATTCGAWCTLQSTAGSSCRWATTSGGRRRSAR